MDWDRDAEAASVALQVRTLEERRSLNLNLDDTAFLTFPIPPFLS
jgi:hypothetical protein